MRTQAVDREAYRGNRGWLAPPTGIGNGKILTGRSVGCWSDGTSEGAGPAKPSELHFLVEMTVDLIPTAAALATLQCSLAMRRASSPGQALGRRSGMLFAEGRKSHE